MRVALFQPDIPQNTGNIFRLAACLEIPVDIIEPTGFLFNDKRFKRSMMDYMQHLKYKRYLDWDSFFKSIKDKNFRLILLTTKSTKTYNNYKFQLNDILLFGRESKGVPQEVHNHSYQRLKIPLKNNTRSLNIAMAAGITLSEALKQNFFFKND